MLSHASSDIRSVRIRTNPLECKAKYRLRLHSRTLEVLLVRPPRIGTLGISSPWEKCVFVNCSFYPIISLISEDNVCNFDDTINYKIYGSVITDSHAV